MRLEYEGQGQTGSWSFSSRRLVVRMRCGAVACVSGHARDDKGASQLRVWVRVGWSRCRLLMYVRYIYIYSLFDSIFNMADRSVERNLKVTYSNFWFRICY